MNQNGDTPKPDSSFTRTANLRNLDKSSFDGLAAGSKQCCRLPYFSFVYLFLLVFFSTAVIATVVTIKSQ
jgi:hypothetical protein